MKKKEKKEKVVKALPKMSEVTASEPVIEETKITKLELDFNNDGLNKMAAKINEIIDAF